MPDLRKTSKELFEDFKQWYPGPAEYVIDYLPYGYECIILKFSNREDMLYDSDSGLVYPMEYETSGDI